MLQWLSEHFSTVLVAAVLLAVVLRIIKGLIANHQKGKSACGCGCSCSGCTGCSSGSSWEKHSSP